MKILILEHDKNLRQLYSTLFENLAANVVVSEASTSIDAINLCSELPYDAIVCCYELFRCHNARDFLDYYRTNEVQSPLILVSASSISELDLNWIGDFDDIFHFLKPVDLDLLVEKVGTLVYNRQFSETTIDRNFVKIKSAYFIAYNRTLTDIFLRLSSNKIVKIMSAGDTYTIDDIEKYLSRGIRNFYIGQSEFNHFKQDYNHIAFLDNITDGFNVQTDMDQWRKGHKALKFLIEEYGISQNTIDVASSVVDETVNKVIKNNNFSSLFDVKYKKDKDYIFNHSYLAAVIGCGILNHLKSSTSAELENMCYLSLFHDISQQNDKLARINGITDPIFQNLSFVEKKDYLNAVNASAQLVQKSNYFSRKVKAASEEYYSMLISHVSAGPTFICEFLSQLTRVFIISHDFVQALYECDFESKNSEEIAKRLLSKYTYSDYLKIINALISCHKNYTEASQ